MGWRHQLYLNARGVGVYGCFRRPLFKTSYWLGMFNSTERDPVIQTLEMVNNFRRPPLGGSQLADQGS